MPTDPLAALADLPGVAAAVADTRSAVDTLLWPRTLAGHGPELAIASRYHGAQACAAVEGADFAVDAWRSGDAWDESPMGLTAAGIWRCYRELPSLVGIWASSPSQVLARLHTLLARDLVDAQDLGRPRQGEAADPLRLGPAPPPADVPDRLAMLSTVVTSGTAAPALVEAAVVHGELLAVRPFGVGSGPIAGMSTRLVMAARGLDPDLLTVPEVGVLKLGRPAYVDALRRYQTGTAAGVAAWIRFICDSARIGAAAGSELLGEISDASLATEPVQE
jgi:hypothetical protein